MPIGSSVNTSERKLSEQINAVRDGAATRLRVDHAIVRDEDLAALEGLEPNLKSINFSRTEITDQGLARLAAMHKLEQLRISSPRITDAGLAELKKLEHLRYLHLLDMPITDAGLEHLHGLKSLESLYLDRTRATDEGFERLVKALPDVHLHIDGGHHHLDPHGKDHDHDHK